MRRAFAWALVALILAGMAAGCGRETKNPDSVQVPQTGQPSQPGPAPVTKPGEVAPLPADVPGNQAELNTALAEPSIVKYQIVLAGDIGTDDKDTYLDKLLTERQWPEANMLVLVVYDQANHDIRFAMGSIFNQKQVKVDEMLTLVRTHYLAKNREGDTAAGLAGLIRAVNQRMLP